MVSHIKDSVYLGPDHLNFEGGLGGGTGGGGREVEDLVSEKNFLATDKQGRKVVHDFFSSLKDATASSKPPSKVKRFAKSWVYAN